MNDRPFIVIGAGGHAKVVVDLLQMAGHTVAGLTDINPALHGMDVLGVPIIGDDDALRAYNVDDIALALGVGETRPSPVRRAVYARLKGGGFDFPSCAHPSAVVSRSAKIGAGAQIMAGAVVQTGGRIGVGAIVNTHASVDHDCQIGAFAHIAPGAVLSGAVNVGEGAHIGVGTTVVEAIRVGAGALVAAGACVINDVAPNGRVGGVPARNL